MAIVFCSTFSPEHFLRPTRRIKTLKERKGSYVHSSKNLRGLFEVLLSFLNEKSQNVENRRERRLKLQGDIPRFSNS